ncbi:hypothetical protein BU038_10345 [Staphylococcus simulans]|nr:hypothetical protein BU038_10345 [Staphylococcus simulans]
MCFIRGIDIVHKIHISQFIIMLVKKRLIEYIIGQVFRCFDRKIEINYEAMYTKKKQGNHKSFTIYGYSCFLG